MTEVKWKSGALVRVLSSDQALRVVGYDSVVSVICELFEGHNRPLRLYASPSLLMEISVEH